MKIEDPELLAEFRGKPCEWCIWIGERPEPGDPAHLYHNGIGGRKQLDIRINLASICRRHHTLSHAGHAPALEHLLVLVARREKTTPDAITAEIRRLQRADKDGREIKRKGVT